MKYLLLFIIAIISGCNEKHLNLANYKNSKVMLLPDENIEWGISIKDLANKLNIKYNTYTLCKNDKKYKFGHLEVQNCINFRNRVSIPT